MQIIDLFSGIGGFSVAGHWCGWDTVQFCEINRFCVDNFLKFYFPDVPVHLDIKTLTYEKIKKNGRFNPSLSTIVTGGFPCQPFSNAGKRKGTADDRNLWPEMRRIIHAVHPRWVVAENVPGIINWSEGLVFEQVCADLENEGYEVTSFILPGCGVGAPHRRDRVWFVAYSGGDGLQSGVFGKSRPATSEVKGKKDKRQRLRDDDRGAGKPEIITDPHQLHGDLSGLRTGKASQQQKTKVFGRNAPHTEAFGLQRSGPDWEQIARLSAGSALTRRNSAGDEWKDWPTVSPLCSKHDGFTTRLRGVTFSKWRAECLKALGNAIVPHVVYQIYLSIIEFENSLTHGFKTTAADPGHKK